MFQEAARSSSKSSSMKLKIIPKVKKEREKLHKQKSNSSLSGGTPPPGPLGGGDSWGRGFPGGGDSCSCCHLSLRNLGHEEWTSRGRPGQLKPHVKCFNSASP